jgi:hypothetical protein
VQDAPVPPELPQALVREQHEQQQHRPHGGPHEGPLQAEADREVAYPEELNTPEDRRLKSCYGGGGVCTLSLILKDLQESGHCHMAGHVACVHHKIVYLGLRDEPVSVGVDLQRECRHLHKGSTNGAFVSRDRVASSQLIIITSIILILILMRPPTCTDSRARLARTIQLAILSKSKWPGGGGGS